MTDSNGRNSNDAPGPMGIGTATATPSGAGSPSGGGTIGGAGVASPNTGAATAPKPRRAAPVKNAPTSAGPKARPQSAASGSGSAKATVRDEATKLKNEATTKARDYANQGKQKATSALDSFAEMMTDAAAEVDERMGPQYGQYARSAADSVAGLASTIRRKEVDELVGDARDFVRKSPAIAIGAAAAVGFVVARLIKAGIEPADDARDDRLANRDLQRSEFDDLPGA